MSNAFVCTLLITKLGWNKHSVSSTHSLNFSIFLFARRLHCLNMEYFRLCRLGYQVKFEQKFRVLLPNPEFLKLYFFAGLHFVCNVCQLGLINFFFNREILSFVRTNINIFDIAKWLREFCCKRFTFASLLGSKLSSEFLYF